MGRLLPVFSFRLGLATGVLLGLVVDQLLEGFLGVALSTESSFLGIDSDTGGTWAAITRIPGGSVCVKLTGGLLSVDRTMWSLSGVE